LIVTFGSQKYFIASDMPRNISVRNSVCALASMTARRGGGKRSAPAFDARSIAGKTRTRVGKTIRSNQDAGFFAYPR
jgi:hypothetical protein